MPKPTTDSKRINLYLPTRYLDIARTMATKKGISFSELMRNAMVEHIRSEAGKMSDGK